MPGPGPNLSGFTARVGFMERADRLALLGVSALASVALAEPRIFIGGLALLGGLSTVTAVQRVLAVRTQANAAVG